MSIIQRIRERGALISAIIIALALLGFIAMDALTQRTNLFGGGPSNTMGRVNGKKINADEFRQKVAIAEQRMQDQGYPSGPETTQQAVEGVWEQTVNEIILQQELDKLGMDISKAEMNAMLYGNNPSPVARQYFSGQDAPYDPNRVSEYVRQVTRGRNQAAKDELNDVLKYIEQTRLNEKFNALLTNSINVPKWKVEIENAERSQMAKISFVRKPYSDIPDSTVKVTDDEIRQYINKHKNDYQQEESRGIAFVSFPVVASREDSMSVYNELDKVKAEMETTTDLPRFLAREGGSSFYDSYISGKKIQISHKDSIFKIGIGQVYGPYVDGDSYSLAKLLGVKQIPDSARSRHILISINQTDPRTGQMTPVRDSAAAKHLIDSIVGLVRAGQNFDSLAAKFSEDPGSKNNGGVYTFSSGPNLAEQFNDFIFTNPVGTKDVVLTDFGYHYIEVLSHIGAPSPAYKIAYLSKRIHPSTSTENAASERASQFAGKSRDEKSFNETYEKELKASGYTKQIAYDITPTAYTINGLGTSREFVRKIYEAKRGEVLQPEKVGSYYVVAVVTEINEKGTESVAKARVRVEPLLRNQKKAEIIKKQVGNITTLEAAATAWGKTIEVADSIRTTGGAVLMFEPRVAGAAFYPANKGKVVPEPLEGRNGVYVIRVEDVMAVPSMEGTIDEQRKAQVDRAKQMIMMGGGNPVNTLKKAAKISDSRATHF